MNRHDPSFRDLTEALQVRYEELRTAGVGAVVKHAPAITANEENLLWKSTVIGVHSSLALLRAVFFYVGKTFVFEGGRNRDDLNVENSSVPTILIVTHMWRIGPRTIPGSISGRKTNLFFHAQRPNLAICWIST